MAKEILTQNQSFEQSPPPPPQETQVNETSIPVKKMALFGAVAFVVQLAVVYFVTVKFIGPTASTQSVAPAEKSEEASVEIEQQIFLLKEVLVNPAGTNGTRFLLTSIGFEMSSLEAKQEIERKEVQVRDVMNAILTSKALPELIDFQRRETIRSEIMAKTAGLVKSGTLKKVYFSKFIIQ